LDVVRGSRFIRSIAHDVRPTLIGMGEAE